MQRATKLYVIGIGYRPLGERARSLVLSAAVILASSRLNEVFTRYEEYEEVKARIKIINKVPETVAFIKEWFSSPSRLTPHSSRERVVLLASGDPLFFGIGRRICEEFGKEMVEILPDLSSVQGAFARINEPWDDALFISLHGGPDIAKRRTLPYEAKDISRLLEQSGKMGILTDRENNPSVVAKALLSSLTPHRSLVMYVCERLGYADEKITRGTPEEIAGMSFADPNVVILMKSGVRSKKSGFRFGLREEDILHERGLITKDEVRAVTLHKLRLPDQGVMWDIGAGSGSVSIEAARICPGVQVFAVEKDTERIATIRQNIARFNARNVELVGGNAPDALADLPAPDRVFIGGSGGNLGLLINLLKERMPSGVVVINAATLDTLNDAVTSLETAGFSIDVAEISVSRSKNVAGKRHMTALNPIFIVKGERG